MKIILKILGAIFIIISVLSFFQASLMVFNLVCILPIFTILISAYYLVKEGGGYFKSLLISLGISLPAFIIFFTYTKLNPVVGEEKLGYFLVVVLLLSLPVVSIILNSIILLMIKSKNKIDKLIS